MSPAESEMHLHDNEYTKCLAVATRGTCFQDTGNDNIVKFHPDDESIRVEHVLPVHARHA